VRALGALLALLVLAACGPQAQPDLKPIVLPHPNRPGWFQVTQMVAQGGPYSALLASPAGQQQHAVRIFGEECFQAETVLEVQYPLARAPIASRFELVSLAIRCPR